MSTSTQPRQATTRPSQRLLWIDLLRGSAVLFVMVNHAIGMTALAGWNVPEWLNTITRTLEPFRLPMLLVVSGMFLPRALAKPLGVYVSGKVNNLLWPLLIWAPVTLITHHPDKLGNLSSWWGPSHLWYLKTLVFCYLLALLSRWIPLWVFPIGLISFRIFGLSHDVSLLWYGPFFFMGALIQPLVAKLQAAPKWFFGLLATTTLFGSGLYIAGVNAMYQPRMLLFSMAGVLTMVWLAPRIPRSGAVKWLEKVGQESIVHYIVHLPVIAVVLRVAESLDAGTVSTLAAASILCIAIPILVTKIKGHRILFALPKSVLDRVMPQRKTPGRPIVAARSAAN